MTTLLLHVNPERTEPVTLLQTNRTQINWSTVTEKAADIVSGYDVPLTLKQLFYRLVSIDAIPATQQAYKSLSRAVSVARRTEDFAPLCDRKVTTYNPDAYADLNDAVDWIVNAFRLDRTEGQDVNLYLAVEVDSMVQQLVEWFGEPFGLSVLGTAGNIPQAVADRVQSDIAQDGRPAVLLYAGDLDGFCGSESPLRYPWGFESVRKVTVTPEQVEAYALAHSGGVYELAAIDPAELEQLFSDAIGEFFHFPTYESVMDRERRERALLAERVGAA